MKKALCIVTLVGLGLSVSANVNVKSLDIYKNRTFVKQQLNTLDNSVDLIGNVRFEDIRFVINGQCKVENSAVKANNYSNDSLSFEIEQLKQNIAFKQNEINSLNTITNALANIKFEKQAVSLENIKSVTAYTKGQLQENNNQVFKLNKQLRKLQNELKVLTTKKNSNKYSSLEYKASCASGSKLYVSYPVYNIRANSFYDINVNSKDKKIDIKNSSYITQSSGYDFKNIDINFYTYNYSSQIQPSIFYPEYLDIYEPPVALMQADTMMMEKAVVKRAKSFGSAKPTYSYNESTTKSFFKASNITLDSGVKTPVVFANESYAMNDSIEVDGYASSKPFYKVEYKSEKLLGALSSRLYLDGVFIGNSFQKEIKKDKDTQAYLGEDRFIVVKKELLKDMKEEPLFSINKIKTEKLWKYTLTNNHKSKKTITLVERLPISKHEDIKVKLISKTKYTKKEANGKISYDLTLKPNETKVLEFGYEVTKPYKK